MPWVNRNQNSASDSEETVSGMDEATQNEDIPEKKGILIAIDPGDVYKRQ